MQKEMKLKCRVGRIDDVGRFPCTSKLFDGTEFTVHVLEHDVLLTEELTEDKSHVDGWMLVVQEGQQGDRVAVTLPHPSDKHGRQVTVNQYDVLPRNLSIDSFNPQN
tara:strand:+ start:202 stop:522 length:321 start_codon:yes stop_codon:yes gene_type:complete